MTSRDNSFNKIILGIDIGGTGIKSSPVDTEKGELLNEPLYLKTPNPSTPSAVLDVISVVIENWQWKGDLGCGFPGVIRHGEVFLAANVSKEWLGVNIVKELEGIAPAKTGVMNDADCAGLAEMKFGAGKPYCHDHGGIVMLLTLGTGIGSALFLDGKLLKNTEFGHIEMDGVDAEKRAATVIMERENLSWEEWGGRVNKYLNMMEMLFSPDVFIIGGGVSESSEKFFKYLNVRAEIHPAKLHNEAGIVGAALSVETDV